MPCVHSHLVTCDFKFTFIGQMIAPLSLNFPSSLLCLVCLSNRVVDALRIVSPVRYKGGKKYLFEVVIEE